MICGAGVVRSLYRSAQVRSPLILPPFTAGKRLPESAAFGARFPPLWVRENHEASCYGPEAVGRGRGGGLHPGREGERPIVPHSRHLHVALRSALRAGGSARPGIRSTSPAGTLRRSCATQPAEAARSCCRGPSSRPGRLVRPPCESCGAGTSASSSRSTGVKATWSSCTSGSPTPRRRAWPRMRTLPWCRSGWARSRFRPGGRLGLPVREDQVS